MNVLIYQSLILIVCSYPDCKMTFHMGKMIKVIRSKPNGVPLFSTFQGDTLQFPNKALTGVVIPF